MSYSKETDPGWPARQAATPPALLLLRPAGGPRAERGGCAAAGARGALRGRLRLLGAGLDAGALAFLLAAPLWGSLSDCIGRPRVLILAAIGIAAGQMIFAATAEAGAAGLLPASLVLAGLGFGRIAYAASAGGALPVAQAQVADLTAPERRLRALAALSGFATIGRLLAPPFAALTTFLSPFAPLHLLSLLTLITAIAVARLPARPGPSRAAARPQGRVRPGPLIAAMLVMCLAGIVQISLGPWLEASLGLRDVAASRWLGVLLGVAAAGTLASQMLVAPRLHGREAQTFAAAGTLLALGALD